MKFLTSDSFPPQSSLLRQGWYLKRGRLQSDLWYHFLPLQEDQFCMLSWEVGNSHLPLSIGWEDTISFGIQALLREIFLLRTTVKLDLVPKPLTYIWKAAGLLLSLSGYSNLGPG